ncbi:6,7-dimethyl-8-ribityllumazine synthase [Synchytrium microbalum]|uniref:6,7-dimethyl-8-ribityllumazine synthase n=1 Tax=Synchytrium microbalum TaxID=1806994 RepID=A0A507C1E7_9FUNG|nr:6,7-dimethyl-8-ribityllumazine synthase [Synchytrium microbalum]TPX31395.1 6,7-dimethyl-8-ribityllumazine synthase [Synchytrium microbalum]
MADHTVKGIEPLPAGSLDGSALRILIGTLLHLPFVAFKVSHQANHILVHTRWNFTIVKQLLDGTISKLKALGVPESSIVIESVPGSFELPIAAQRLLTSAQRTASSATDLFTTDSPSITKTPVAAAYDAAICIGVLIKGSTMHFEYIADSTTKGLMRVGLDTGLPVVFGVLTCLTEDQAFDRAGMGRGPNGKGHNHGEDWAAAAVEMGLLKKRT